MLVDARIVLVRKTTKKDKREEQVDTCKITILFTNNNNAKTLAFDKRFQLVFAICEFSGKMPDTVTKTDM